MNLYPLITILKLSAYRNIALYLHTLTLKVSKQNYLLSGCCIDKMWKIEK